MAGFDPFANRPHLSKWRMRIISFLSPIYEEANEIVELSVAQYNKKNSQLNAHI